jgi:hypothetical protein
MDTWASEGFKLKKRDMTLRKETGVPNLRDVITWAAPMVGPVNLDKLYSP